MSKHVQFADEVAKCLVQQVARPQQIQAGDIKNIIAITTTLGNIVEAYCQKANIGSLDKAFISTVTGAIQTYLTDIAQNKTSFQTEKETFERLYHALRGSSPLDGNLTMVVTDICSNWFVHLCDNEGTKADHDMFRLEEMLRLSPALLDWADLQTQLKEAATPRTQTAVNEFIFEMNQHLARYLTGETPSCTFKVACDLSISKARKGLAAEQSMLQILSDIAFWVVSILSLGTINLARMAMGKSPRFFECKSNAEKAVDAAEHCMREKIMPR